MTPSIANTGAQCGCPGSLHTASLSQPAPGSPLLQRLPIPLIGSGIVHPPGLQSASPRHSPQKPPRSGTKKHFPDAQPQPDASAHGLSFGSPGGSWQEPVSVADAVTSVVLVLVLVALVGSGGTVVDEVIGEVGSVSVADTVPGTVGSVGSVGLVVVPVGVPSLVPLPSLLPVPSPVPSERSAQPGTNNNAKISRRMPPASHTHRAPGNDRRRRPRTDAVSRSRAWRAISDYEQVAATSAAASRSTCGSLHFVNFGSFFMQSSLLLHSPQTPTLSRPMTLASPQKPVSQAALPTGAPRGSSARLQPSPLGTVAPPTHTYLPVKFMTS